MLASWYTSSCISKLRPKSSKYVTPTVQHHISISTLDNIAIVIDSCYGTLEIVSIIIIIIIQDAQKTANSYIRLQ